MTGGRHLQLKAVIQETGARVNAQRAKRGLEPRAVRACVIGFPNVGKSALINRCAPALPLAAASAGGQAGPAPSLRQSGSAEHH